MPLESYFFQAVSFDFNDNTFELSVDGRLLRPVGDAAHGSHQVPQRGRGRARPRHRRRQQIRVSIKFISLFTLVK